MQESKDTRGDMIAQRRHARHSNTPCINPNPVHELLLPRSVSGLNTDKGGESVLESGSARVRMLKAGQSQCGVMCTLAF